MFRLLVRRIPRFSLPTLMAAMLFVVSFGGAVRTGFGPDYQESAALRALEAEGIPYTAVRSFSGKTDATTLAWDAWNPFRRFANWLMRHEDRVTAIRVAGWPSEKTRKLLFDLPYLQELDMQHPPAGGPPTGPDRVPPPEEILGRPLPEFADSRPASPEPPPVPKGEPLSDEERAAAISELSARVDSPSELHGEAYLCRAESTDFQGLTLVTASDGESSWQLHYDVDRYEASAVTNLTTPRARVGRVRNGGWETESALRAADDDFFVVTQPSLAGVWPAKQMARVYWYDVDPDDAYESVERLADGTLALRLRPRIIWEAPPPRGSARLIEGLVIVDPQHDYSILRFESVQDNSIPGMTTSVCYVFDYANVAGRRVPVRVDAWTDLPPRSLALRTIPGGPRSAVTRYAWDFDPELPEALFEPPREEAAFFTSKPERRFHWWYVTGGISLVWMYFVVSRGIRRRFRRRMLPNAVSVDDQAALAEAAEAP